MKILRRHKGFTTNSSSASEWLIPGKPVGGGTNQYDASGNLVSNASTTAVTEAASSPTPPSNPLAGNTLMVVGLLGAVLGLFAVERLIRRILKKKSIDEDI